jgi:hypothetical protein
MRGIQRGAFGLKHSAGPAKHRAWDLRGKAPCGGVQVNASTEITSSPASYSRRLALLVRSVERFREQGRRLSPVSPDRVADSRPGPGAAPSALRYQHPLVIATQRSCHLLADRIEQIEKA